MFVCDCQLIPLPCRRRRESEVVDLARGARELVAHGLDGAQCGHPRETRLVAYPFVHRLRVLAVKIIVPGLLARADERHAHVLIRESAVILRDARLLRPRLRGVFALRALCDRGRAAPTSETPAAFARLIGGGTSRPRTRAAAKVPASPGLPDPLAHLVCKFWLGEPPRRRRAAPATE